MYGLPPNMKGSSQKTWQTSLLFIEPLQIQNLKRKKWGDMAYYVPPSQKGGSRPVAYAENFHVGGFKVPTFFFALKSKVW